MQLSENFALKEFTRSDTATRLGLDNTPSDEVIANLKLLIDQIIQPVRTAYGRSMTINSGYRAPEVNAAVGGSRTSDHCRGQAADIEIPGIPNYDLACYIADNFQFTQIILEFYTPGIPDSGWVHVSYDPNNLKCERLTAMKENGKTVYKHGFIQ